MMKMPQNSQPQPEKANEFCPYDADTEIAMKKFYDSLSEKDKRRYAGIEALKLGHGGQKYIAKVLGCSRGTVKKGACEVSDLPPKEVDKRIRQAGGGRKKYSEKWAKIDEQFLTVLQEHTAGDPMDERVIWTDLNHKEIGDGSRFDQRGRNSRKDAETPGEKTLRLCVFARAFGPNEDQPPNGILVTSHRPRLNCCR